MQPVTAYSYTEIWRLAALENSLGNLGFERKPKTVQAKRVFGDVSFPVAQIRYEASSAGRVMKNIIALPGAERAIAQAKETLIKA